MTANASGDLNYQWYHTSVAEANKIGGGTGVSVTVAPTSTINKYIVVVTDRDNYCVGQGDTTITVNTKPVVAITAPTADQTICEGDQVTLAATAVASATYTWYDNNIEIVGASQSMLTLSPETVANSVTAHRYTVMAALADPGCESDTVGRTVTVQPRPEVVVTGPALHCSGAEFTLTAMLRSVSTGTENFKWYLNGASTPVADQNVTIATPFTTTTLIQTKNFRVNPYMYTVLATEPNGCSIMSDPFYVYVDTTPTVTIATTSAAVCEGGEVTLTANASGDLNYQWYHTSVAEANKIGDGTGVSVTVAPTATINKYIVVVTDRDNYCVGQGDTTITVNAKPVVAITAPTADQTICEGGQVTLEATIVAGATYTWYDNNIEIAGASQSMLTLSPDAVANNTTVHNYTVVASLDDPGCESDMSAVRKVTVEPKPVVVLSGQQDICTGNASEIQIYANVTGSAVPMNDPSVVATWYRNNQETGIASVAASPNTLIYTESPVPTVQDEAYYYHVTLTNVGTGCSVSSEPYPIYIRPVPTVFVEADQIQVCKGGNVTLTAHIDNANLDNIVYQWYKDPVAPALANIITGATEATYISGPITENSTYWVIAKQTTTDCADTTKIDITMSERPVVEVAIDNDSICEGNQVQLTASVTSGGVANVPYTYTWKRNGELIENVDVNSFTEAPTLAEAINNGFEYVVIANQVNSGCASDPDTIKLTVFPHPTVEITGDPIICKGTDVELTANINDTIENGGPYMYEWRLANSTVAAASTNNTYTTTQTPSDNPYIYTVVATNNLGCSSVSDPFYVYVNDSILVEVTPELDSVCAGGQVMLTAHIGNPNANDLTYRWYTVAGSDEEIHGATEASVTVAPTATTDYKVVILQTSSACTATGTAQVKVLAAPVIDLTVSDDTICEGTELTLTATEIENGSYTWTRNHQIVENANSNVLVDAPETNNGSSASYVYEVVFTSNIEGCISNVAKDTVYLYNNNTVEISGNSLICNGTDVELTANINDTIADAVYSFQWRLNNVDIAGATNRVYTNALAAQNEPYIYTVVVSNNKTDCQVVSEPYYVYVNADIEVVVTATDTIICEGGYTTLTANLGDYNASNLTYQWYAGATLISGATLASITVNPASTVTYRVVVNQTTSGCTAEGTREIEVNAIPTVTLNFTDSSICVGGQVELIATATPAGNYTYTWSDNNVVIDGVSDSNYVVSPFINDGDVTAHAYTVVATSDLPGCASLSSVAANVSAYPNPSIFLYGDGVVCDGADFDMTANITGLYYEPVTVTWYEGEMISLGAATALSATSYLLEDNQSARSYPYVYTVEVTTGNGCVVRSNEHRVLVMAEPEFNIFASDDTVCVDGNITFNVSLNDPNESNLIYQWKKDGVTQPGATASVYVTSFDAAGTHSVEATVFNTASECEVTKSMDVEIMDVPEISSLTISADTACSGYEVLVQAATTGGAINDTVFYTWYRNGVELTGITADHFTEVLTATTDTIHYVYTVVATQPSAGCVSVAKSDTIIIVPAISVEIQGDPIICHGTQIELTANVNDYSLAGDLHYQWRLFNNNIGTDNAQLTLDTTESTDPYIFTVLVSNSLNCNIMSAPFAVYVNDTITLEITHDNDSICPGAEVTFVANIGDYHSPNLVFRWSKVNPGVDTTEIWGATQPIYTATPTTSGYNYYQAEVLQTTSGCVAKGIDSVKVVEAPAIEIIEVTDTAICEGGQITITATPMANGYYTWYKNGQRVEGVNFNYITDSPVTVDGDATDYEYGVVFTPTTPGCQSVLVDTTVHVYPNPTLVIEGDAIVCTQATPNNIKLWANFADTIPEAIAGFQYEWRESNNVITTATTDTLEEYRPFRDEPYIYTVVATNSRGCNIMSAPYAVYVNDSIIVEVTHTADSICPGGEVTLTANIGDYNSPNLVYRWYTTNGATETPIWGATQAELVVTPMVTTNYMVRVTQTTSACQAEGYDTIKVINNPVLSIAVDQPDTLCAGGEFTLTATSNWTTPNGYYAWYRNSVLVPGANASTLTESPLPVDNDYTYYEYEVVYFPEVEGCKSDTVDTIMHVFSNPTVVISGDPLVCNYPANVSLTANVNDHHGELYDTANFAPLYYEWRISNSNTDQHTAHIDTVLPASENPYIYTVLVGDLHGCVTLSAPYYVYVNDTASIQVEITADNDSVCHGGEITMTGHLADYNSPNLTYQWYVLTADGDTVEIPEATELSLTIVMDTTTTFLLKVTQTTSGCVAWGQHEIFVWPELPWDVSAVKAENVANHLDLICDGGEIDVVVSIQRFNLSTMSYEPADSTDFTYVWYRNGFEDPLLHGPWFRESPLAVDGDSTRYTYSAAIVLGIPGCEFSNALDDTITVVRNPVVDIYGDPYVCEYQPIILNARVNGDYQVVSEPNTNGTFYWYRDGEMRTGYVPTIYGEYYEEPTFTQSGSNIIGDPTTGYAHRFQVEYVNSNGCSGFSPEFLVEVVEAPVVTITADHADNTISEHRDSTGSIINACSICEDGQVTLTANLSNQNIPYLVYIWYENERIARNVIPGAVNPTYTTPRLDTTTTYIVDVYSRLVVDTIDYDMSALGLCVATHEYTVYVETDPVVDSIKVNGEFETYVCDGGQVRVEAFVHGGVVDQNGEYNYYYTWFRNNNLIEGAHGPVFIESPLTVDGDVHDYEYSVAVTQIYSGCQSADTTVATVHVYPNPTVRIDGDPIMCTVDTVVLSANVTGEYIGANLTYTWKLANDTLNDDETTATYQVIGAADNDTIHLLLEQSDNPYIFTVVIANEHGCTVESDPFYQYVDTAAIIQVTAFEDSICRGGYTILTANIGDYNMPNLTYTWEQRHVGATDWEPIHGALQREIQVYPDSTMEYRVNIFQTTSACLGQGTIVIKVNDVPVVDSVILSDYVICEGGVVNVAGYASRGVGSEYTFHWYNNADPMVDMIDPTFNTYPVTVDGDTTNYIYSAFVTQTANGCISQITYADKLTVYPNPTVVIDYDPTVCEDDTIVLIANVTNEYPTAGLTFTWLLANDTITPATPGYVDGYDNDTLRVVFPPRDHNYIFNVVVANNHGCTTLSEAVEVNVAPRPIIDVTAYEVDFCQGGWTRLTTHIDNYNLSNLTYSWTSSNPAEDMSWALERIIDVDPNDTTTYYVRVYQVGSECVSTDSITLNVCPIPVVDSVTLSEYYICDGGQVTITAHVSNTTGVLADTNYFYTWFRNGIEIPDVHGNSFIESPLTVDQDVTTYTYTAIVHQIESGCNSLPVSADILTVYRNPIPVIDGDQYVCEMNNVYLITYTDTTSINVGELHYQWYINGELRDNLGFGMGDSRYFAEHLYHSTEPYVFTVEVTRGNGCSRFSDPFNVYVEARPLVEITSTETNICTGGSVTLTANLENYHHNDLIFQWYKDSVTRDNEIYGATQYTYTTDTLDTTTRFLVRVWRERSECFDVDTIDINVYPDPVIDSITVSNAIICDGAPVVVTAHANLNDTLGRYTYTWFRNGIEIPDVHGNSFTDYPVIVDHDVTTFVYSAIVTQNAAGCTSAEVASEEVVVNPHPTVTIVPEASTTVCEGGEVVLHANVDPADNDYQYIWYRDNEIIEHDTNVQFVRGLAAREEAYEYFVTVISNPGCTTTSAPIDVNIVAKPIVTITGDDDAICEGGVTTMTASFTAAVEQVNGLGTYQYTWYEDGVEVGTGETYTTVDTLAIGNHTYSVVLTFDNPAYGCDVNSAVQGGAGLYTLNVVADPQPTIIIETGYDAAICETGSTKLVVDNIVGGVGTVAYQWYRNGVIIPGETNATLVTDPTLPVADYTYYVVVTMSGVDCEGTSNMIVVPVMAKPTAVITGVENVCVGGQITLTATVDTTYGQNVQYQWNKVENGSEFPINGATSSTFTTDTLLLAGSYSYSITITNPISGCTFTSSARNANVVADPVVRILGNEPVCEGGSVELVTEITGGISGADYNYTWYRDNQVVGPNASTLTTDPNLAAGNHYYRVEITPADYTGCDAISATVNAPVIAVPEVTITGYNTVCEGGSVVLNANVQPTGTYNYVWYKDGVVVNAPNSATFTTDPSLVPGTYTYGVEVYNNELGTSCTASATFDYTVVVDPIIDSIVTSLPNNQMCAGGNITLTAYMNNGMANADVVYTWTRNGSVIVNATLAEITESLTTPGTYTYTVVASQSTNNSFGCQSAPATVTIEVVPQPFVAISYNGLLQVCEGGFVELTAVIEGGVDEPSIRWRMNGAQMTQFNDMVTIQTVTELGIGDYNYSVDVTYPAATGCAVATTANPVTVSVVNNPIWQTSVARYPDLCVGDQVELEASIEGGVVDANGQTGAYIQWVYAPVTDPSDITNVSGGLGGYTYDITTNAGIYTYYPTYVAPANSNCTPSNTPNASTITVHELPTATMELADGSDIICWNNDNDQATIELHFTGSAPFSFMIQDMTTNAITTFEGIYTTYYTITVNPSQTTTYQILNLSDRYCNGIPQNINTVTVVVSRFELINNTVEVCPDDVHPLVVFNFNNLTISDTRDTVWYTIDDYNNLGFDYTSGPVVVDGLTASAEVYMPSADPGTYQFGLIIDGCEYDVTVTILWNGDFAGRIMDQKWDDVAICNNNPATNGGYRFVSFQWYKNGQPIEGATNQYYQEIGGLNGFYSLKVIDEFGNEYTTCEEQFVGQIGPRVYPVPARVNDVITIELPLTDEELNGAVLDIYDAKGALVRHIDHIYQVTRLQGFSAQGTYFGRITTGTNEVKTVKFIIVK